MALITKDEFKKLTKEKGNVVGVALKNNFEFVLEKKGKEGLKKVERALEKLGFPLKYQELKSFQWLPEKMNLILLLVIRRTFNWNDEMMREMGRWTARASIITRIMMKYFVSFDRVSKEVSKYWRKYHTFGSLEPEALNEKEKYAILVLTGYNFVDPSHCRYMEGYFYQIASYIFPEENLKVEEIECILSDGKTHRFKITW